MWNKIKKVLQVLFAFASIVFFTVLIFVLRRSDSDGCRSSGDAERDRAIKDGIAGSEERLKNSTERIAKCEEHLQRAESILREAIKRSQQKE